MLRQGWLLILLIASVTTALGPPPHQTSEESLRSALNAVTRKQRSLDTNSQEYYKDLHSFKYHGDPDRKFERDHQGGREVNEMEEEIEFLPNVPNNGQLETVGESFQGMNNKLLERALIDYLENTPEQEEIVPSMFRERERSSSRKRGGNTEQLNINDKELADLYLAELQDSLQYNPGEREDEDYPEKLQILTDRYRDAREGEGNKHYESKGPMSWSDVLDKQEPLVRDQIKNEDNEFIDGGQDQSILYMLPAERRNVNGRYPIGREFGNYRSLAKRYPVAKRSPRPLQTEKQITDPKVAQDLGALFGAQLDDGHNHTHAHDHNHKHEHEYKHEQDHGVDHGHDHGHDHDHNHVHTHDHAMQGDQESSSEMPKITVPPKGQNESITKNPKPDTKAIEVKKKSIDWSQYFGIDRRRKKATFMARQGTQNQDDEWMLQRYYENMAENMKPSGHDSQRDSNEQKDKFEQVDSKLKNIKDVIIEEALRYSTSEDGIDLQKVKDEVMARMAAAYTLEKMRKALSELWNNVDVLREAQKASQTQRNLTSNYRELESGRNDDKRNSGGIGENKVGDESNTCPELEAIKLSCGNAVNVAGSKKLYVSCIMLQVCKACAPYELQEGCHVVYAMETDSECAGRKDRPDGSKAQKICTWIAMILQELQPSAAIALQCQSSDSCLRRYRPNRHADHPELFLFGERRYRNGYEMPESQPSNR